MKKKKAQPKVGNEASDPAITLRANYGSAENRRSCHACGSLASSVVGTRRAGNLVIRYRKCSSCGQRRCTQETIVAMP